MKIQFRKDLHILVDGPDGTGKTTICKLLSSELGIPVIKLDHAKEYFKKGTIEDAAKAFNETVVQFKDTPFIIDRGYISSRVYAKVYKRPDDLEYINAIESTLRPTVFILTASTDTLIERRPEDEVIKKKERMETRDEYENIAIEHGYNLIDTTGRTPDEIINEIMYVLECME